MECCSNHISKSRYILDNQGFSSNCITEPYERASPDILYEEITCRALLWTDQLVRTISSCSLREVRHLAADTFEMIGVIVFCALQCFIYCLVCCCEDLSRTFITAQKWVENTAETISGEAPLVASLRNLQDKANTKMHFFELIQPFIPFTVTEREQWTRLHVEVDNSLGRGDLERIRRINRTPERLETAMNDLTSTLSNLETFFVSKEPATLFYLHEALVRLGEEPSDSIESLVHQYYNTIKKLHSRDDPGGVLGNAIEQLSVTLKETMSARRTDLLPSYWHTGGLANLEIHLHKEFFPILKELAEIRYFYSYRESNTLDVEDLNGRIAKCRDLFTNRIPIAVNQPMTKQKALEILNLQDNESIRDGYKRLILIHHPDRGGDTAVFQTIQAAYEFLNNCDREA